MLINAEVYTLIGLIQICFDHKNLWVCYLNIFIVSDTKWYFLCQFLIQNKYVTTHKPYTKWGYHWGFGSCVDHITTDIDLSFIIATWTITQLFALQVREQQCRWSYYNELQFWMHILYWLKIYEILFTVHIKYKI